MQRILIIPLTLFDHTIMKSEINDKGNKKYISTWKLNNTFTDEIKQQLN